jgi:hypothetical protein
MQGKKGWVRKGGERSRDEGREIKIYKKKRNNMNIEGDV